MKMRKIKQKKLKYPNKVISAYIKCRRKNPEWFAGVKISPIYWYTLGRSLYYGKGAVQKSYEEEQESRKSLNNLIAKFLRGYNNLEF